MEYRSLGGTGLRVSALGFGCGNIGGLLIRGSVAERERAVARAIELGINYFDTAASYGDGQSEEHLGRALRALKVSPFVAPRSASPTSPSPRLPELSLAASRRVCGDWAETASTCSSS